jgi:hypothetical protein
MSRSQHASESAAAAVAAERRETEERRRVPASASQLYSRVPRPSRPLAARSKKTETLDNSLSDKGSVSSALEEYSVQSDQSEDPQQTTDRPVRPLRIPRDQRPARPALPPKREIEAELKQAQKHQLVLTRKMDECARTLQKLEDDYRQTQDDIAQMQKALARHYA